MRHSGGTVSFQLPTASWFTPLVDAFVLLVRGGYGAPTRECRCTAAKKPEIDALRRINE